MEPRISLGQYVSPMLQVRLRMRDNRFDSIIAFVSIPLQFCSSKDIHEGFMSFRKNSPIPQPSDEACDDASAPAAAWNDDSQAPARRAQHRMLPHE